MKKGKKLLKSALVLLFWLVVWQLLSLAVGKELLLPAPWSVLVRLGGLVSTASFWSITATSFLRIICGVLLALVLGIGMAVLCCRFSVVHAICSPLLTVIKSTPVSSFIILLLLWICRDWLPVVIVILMVLPVVWGNVCAGIRNVDPLLLRTAKVFHFPRRRLVRRIYVPSVMPHFLSACRTSLGLAWKAGIAAEVLTVPVRSIGKLLYESKLYWETVDLFAWTLVVILCSLLIESVCMALVGFLSRAFKTGGAES